jgi:hypothetical protein
MRLHGEVVVVLIGVPAEAKSVNLFVYFDMKRLGPHI